MTMGIYTLNFVGTDKVYVGQSVNIENRFIAHKKYMRAGRANYKLQEAYTKFGIPILKIICETDNKDELNELESEAFSIFDCIANGFNIASEPDIYQEGELNGYAKYTNDQILQVFELLLDPYNSFVNISEKAGVARSTVSHIANCESHSWLSREYPDKYKIMVSLKGFARQSAGNSSKSQGKELPMLISPDGKEYTITTSISNFAKEHGLDSSCLAKVLKRTPKYNSHKGWKLKQ